jgi:NAD(P)-dependent dehydrogenase (short-subunit alcohol dehydrogenase family)
VSRFAAGVEAELGPAAVLVNNAGYAPFARFEEISLSEWRRTIDVNLDGLFLMTRAFLPAMREAGWGRIVNVSSAVCWDAERREVVHYAASKLGVVGFTRALAGEVGVDGVTVNCICPGIIRTPLLEERIPAEQWTRYLERQAVKRDGVPADLLAALTMLVSEESGFVTGTVLPVHGGRVVV